MSLDPEITERIVHELRPILGGRVQRIDVVDVREFVIELRCPGRTFRLLVSARPGFGRLHLVDRRPPRLVPGGSLQSLLRKRLIGRPLVALVAEGAGVELVFPGTRVSLRFHPRKDALRVEATEEGGSLSETAEIPEDFPLNAAVAAEYATRDQGSRQERQRAALLSPLVARKKKLEKLRRRVEDDRARLEALAPERHRAELLKTALGQVRRGASTALVLDWTSGETVELTLDPALEPRVQMERWFQRAKKADRGLPRVQVRLAELAAELAALEARVEAIRRAEPEALDALDALEPASEQGPRAAPRGGREAKPTAPIDKWSRRFLTEGGREVRVGKGAAENDRLTFAAAKGTDIWLHARGVPGSHVLLRRGKGEPLLQEALLDAAHLAVHFSDARNEAKAEVVYTEARNVKKQKGAAPGRVSLSKEKTLWLAVEPGRLARLLGGEKK